MKRLLISMAASAVALSASVAWPKTPDTPVYKQANASIEARVADLLARMTLEEKIAQLESLSVIPVGPGALQLFKNGALDEVAAKKALGLGIGTFSYSDMPGKPGTPADLAGLAAGRNKLQAWIIDNSRLGIPVMFHGEALHGGMFQGATMFPQAVALGSTWDRDLLKQVFGVAALESRAIGHSLVLAPVFDLSRDPRYGRVEEMYSEDPYLAGEMGLAAVQGLQGTGPTIDQDHVVATAKHFVHGQPENGTNVGPSDFSERTMRQIFFRPFEKVVRQGGIGAIMPSYNENRGGIPSSSDTWLLKDVLRGEWGFTGITVSDYWAVARLATEHHIAPDVAAAGVLAFNSGVDMELPNAAGFQALADAVRQGKVSQADVDAAASRVLATKFRAGLFEHPFSDPKRAAQVIGTARSGKLARKAADEAIVLLRNENNVLPFSLAGVKTIAVIGPNADKARTGTYAGTPPYFVTVLDGIRKRVGPGVKVVYAEGSRISETDVPGSNSLMPYKAPKDGTQAELLDEAVKTARAADAVILVLGGNEVVSREAFGDSVGLGASFMGDTDSLDLPGRQDDLAKAVMALGKPTAAVLLNGRPYAIEKLSNTVPAILEGWYLGQETGNAIAAALFGDTNPSGHLTVTIARNVGQLPVFYYKTPASRLGYVLDSNAPLYPFGHGLSYTTFNMGEPSLDRSSIGISGTAKVSVSVTNTGKRAGDEVVQLYVHHPLSSVVQPVQQLRGFQRVSLQPGETKTISFDVGREQLEILDRKMNWVVEPGKVDLLVGSSAVDTKKVELLVEG